MRRILIAIVALLGLWSCTSDRSKILKIYNWADYIDEDLLEEFKDWYKEETGEDIEIVYQLFDINEVMLSKIERGHEDFDIVCPSDYIIERMLRSNLLLPIDKNFGSTPNYIDKNRSPYFTYLFSKMRTGEGIDANDYAVGYMWGTMGLLYNENRFSREDLSSWASLRRTELKGKLFVKDAFRDVYTSLLIFLKHQDVLDGKLTLKDVTEDDSIESIALVEEYLNSFKDNVSGWEADFGKEQMTKEAAWVNYTWSGDAQWAIEEAAEVGVPLDYVVPDEGSIVWFDGWVIPKYARNVKAASYFINFLCMQENAVRNMDAIGYVSVIGGEKVLETMEDSTLYEPVDASYFFGDEATSVCLNPVMYPDRSVVERCMIMHDSPSNNEALLAMWSRVKGDNATDFTYILISVAMLVLLYGGIRKKVRKRQRHNKF